MSRRVRLLSNSSDFGLAENGGGQDDTRDLARTALEHGGLFGRAAAAGHRADKIRKGHNQKIGLFRFLTR